MTDIVDVLTALLSPSQQQHYSQPQQLAQTYPHRHALQVVVFDSPLYARLQTCRQGAGGACERALPGQGGL